MVKIAVEKLGSNHYEVLTRIMGFLGQSELSSRDRILIKPNIVEPVSHKTGSITNINLVDATIR
jgi:hypothetical protein